jgi:tRNA-splicing ligase RtcB
MQVIYEPGQTVPIKAWIDGVELEDQARQQLINTAKMPFIFKHLAVLPDVHFGLGATVGSVIATKGAIIPAAVGVDVGCGMVAQRTSLTANDLPDSLAQLRSDIERTVPVGFSVHKITPNSVASTWNTNLAQGYHNILKKYPKLETKPPEEQLGTMGGGNHFLELCLDEDGKVWLMLHSGSRGVGNRIGQMFIEMARNDMKKHFINLPDKDLAYFPENTEHFDDYMIAVGWAQEYAMFNRQLMLERTLKVLREKLPTFTIDKEATNCHHNYVALENHFGSNVYVTRKGAVRARENDFAIIPGSMGTRSYIARGKGNPESFNSCSHGAGRRMSRNKAKENITLEDHIKATEGVECRKDAGVLDESPAAYKNLDAVIAAETDLIEVVHTLKAILCVKG